MLHPRCDGLQLKDCLLQEPRPRHASRLVRTSHPHSHSHYNHTATTLSVTLSLTLTFISAHFSFAAVTRDQVRGWYLPPRSHPGLRAALLRHTGGQARADPGHRTRHQVGHAVLSLRVGCAGHLASGHSLPQPAAPPTPLPLACSFVMSISVSILCTFAFIGPMSRRAMHSLTCIDRV